LSDLYGFGWKSMAKESGSSRRTLIRLKDILIAEKVIDYPLIGRPPKRLMRWNRFLFVEFVKKNQKL
jgi:hypothetical protein